MGKKIICESCGAEYDENLVRCPSCGSTNLKGAEKAYMERLEDVREDMEELDEAPRQELKRTLKKQGRWMKWVFIVVGVLILLAGGLIFWENKRYERDYKAEYLWKQENFPKLDALYDAGEYEELAELYATLLEDENCVTYEWEHYNFVGAYLSVRRIEEHLAEEDPDEISLALLLSYQWDVKGLLLHRDNFTAEEYSILEPYIEMSEADFASRWNMSEKDYNAFYEQLEESGGYYVSYDDCRKYVKKWMKENR